MSTAAAVARAVADGAAYVGFGFCSSSSLQREEEPLDAGWVARTIETSRRREVLPWALHREVAGLDADQQDQALDWAEERWPKVTRRDVRRYVRRLKAGSRFNPDKFPEGKFRTLYADPPWSYGNEQRCRWSGPDPQETFLAVWKSLSVRPDVGISVSKLRRSPYKMRTKK